MIQNGGQVTTVAQLLVFNEFEQRFSTSNHVNCFERTTLSDIDSAPGTTGDAQSIFNVAVEGTLTGQTRIRGVPSNQPDHGLLGVAEEAYSNGFSTAFNLHYNDQRADGDGDSITIPVP